MKYLPFLDGKYSVAPGLQPLKKIENPHDKLVFQIDSNYKEYLQNKHLCRKEDINKYYNEVELDNETAIIVNQFIVNKLLEEYPAYFKFKKNNAQFILSNVLNGEILQWNEDWIKIESETYLSLFDALVMQVQEDCAICQVKGEKDWMAAIHVCAANHWAPQEKAGKPFNEIHSIVPGMEKTMPHYFKMLLSVIDKGPYTRYAWGIATDNRLNHHPKAPIDADEILWKGRKIEKGCELFVRVEKQTLNGFPSVNAFFFTIRTYFYPVNSLEKSEKEALMLALENMTDPALAYKGLSGKMEILRKILL